MLRFWWSSNGGTGNAVLIINALDAKWYRRDDSFGALHSVDFNGSATEISDVHVRADGGRYDKVRVTELIGSHP